ncbi:MAG: hypothetical protein DPW09_15185 [Anaerolineae bacterium]|nr:hypothetical protein [Anaerolineales bacterium]MCQ3974784.1 hypothetical protein [Anaerolineae bacterium]
MALPFIVVDQNYLRDEQLLSECIARANINNEFIILADTAFVEMMKNPNWKYTVQQSLKVLAKYPESVLVAYSCGKLLRMERNSGIPQFDIVDRIGTLHVQRILYEINKGMTTFLDSLEKDVLEAQAMAHEQQLNHSENRKYVAASIEFWKSSLPNSAIKQLRKGDRNLFQELLTMPFLSKMCYFSMISLGWSEDAAKHLVSCPSASSHNFLCIAARGLKYIAKGGFESIRDKHITNAVADLDYLFTATFCRELLTKENDLRELYEDVCVALAKKWTEKIV